MLNPKTTLLLVLMVSCSMTMTGCAGIGGIFSGLLDGVMASFGDLFTAEGFTGFLGNVLGSAAQELGPQLAEGNMDSGDIWGSLGDAAMGELSDRASNTDWSGIAKDAWENRDTGDNKGTQEDTAKTGDEESTGKDSTKTQSETDDAGGSTGSNDDTSTK